MSDAPAEESATTVGEVNTAPVENACTELKTAMEKWWAIIVLSKRGRLAGPKDIVSIIYYITLQYIT